MTSLSVFYDVPQAAYENKSQLEDTFKKDTDGQKIFLGQRVFLSNDGKPWVPSSVQKTCRQILHDPTLNFENVSGGAPSAMIEGAKELVFGKNSTILTENRVGGIQTLGSRGALWIGAQFLHQWYNTIVPNKTVCLPLSTSGRYHQIFEDSGFTDICSYRVWNSKTKGLALQDMLEDLKKCNDSTVVLLQIACNPNGIQITCKEWEQIANVLKEKKMFPFFHMQAQGLASGDVDQDAWPLRYFVDEGFELFCAQSFSANFALYGERVGSLLVVLKSNEALIHVRSQLERLVCAKSLEPPAFGSKVVATVLNNASHFSEWKENLRLAAQHLKITRGKIKDRLRILGSLESWEHITQQNGFVIYTGLTQAQLNFLAMEKHLYLRTDGCMNISCLNTTNLNYVMHCIVQATHLITEGANRI